jgi:hypothetical protein
MGRFRSPFEGSIEVLEGSGCSGYDFCERIRSVSSGKYALKICRHPIVLLTSIPEDANFMANFSMMVEGTSLFCNMVSISSTINIHWYLYREIA